MTLAADRLETGSVDRSHEIMELQMGPSHPASHGTIKFNLKLDGETIVDCDVEIGYLHRGFEKMCEQGTWTQVFPYTDRLNYASPLLNNVGFALAAEKLADIQAPERAQWIRMLTSEISRITDHLTCLGMAGVEVGAFTVGLYTNEAREYLYDLVEAITGARLTVSYCRIGGVTNDLPARFGEVLADRFAKIRAVLVDCDKLLTRNRIFVDRMSGVGLLSQEDAIAYSLTGPLLRATGVNYDVRKQCPYLFYDQVDFEVPLGSRGDNYDRFVVRFREIEQSMRIAEQCLAKMPPGPVIIRDSRFALPPKRDVYNSIEGLMNHFKIVMEGIKLPAGETYQAVEGANGELGFYLVSDGSGRPYRVRVRPPCFFGMASLGDILKGHMIADIVTTFGMINMIGGECDR
ncbi:MAG TPA: NADH-quinone oxidoreductase subunit D [Candidatus Binatia bacterium]|nr:NADH-quinone oxidoreductase subunit D [Candidatus Binatia bacterium]